MSDSPVFGGGDFFANMLGDLLRMMPGGSGVQWQLAYQLAITAAAGDEPDPNPDPRERIRLAELSAIAELHVADVTGMRLSPSGRSPVLVPTSRAEWARRTLDTWKPVLERLTQAVIPGEAASVGKPDAARADLTAAGLDLEPDSGADGAALLGKLATAMLPMMLSMQVGSVVGHLAGRALGQYEIPLAPAIGDELLVVSSNMARTAEDWSLAPDDLGLWLCCHEMAYHAVLSRPHVAERLATLVVAHAQLMRPDGEALASLMGDADPNDVASLMHLFGDPAALSARSDGGAQEAVRRDLDALTATISGYVEHVTTTVAGRLIGSHAPILEAMRRRRVGRGQGEKVAEQLLGLRLDQEQADRGARFVAGVLERSGEAELARLFVDEKSLPTPPEVDAPGLWLARLGLADDPPLAEDPPEDGPGS